MVDRDYEIDGNLMPIISKEFLKFSYRNVNNFSALDS